MVKKIKTRWRAAAPPGRPGVKGSLEARTDACFVWREDGVREDVWACEHAVGAWDGDGTAQNVPDDERLD